MQNITALFIVKWCQNHLSFKHIHAVKKQKKNNNQAAEQNLNHSP